MISVCESCLNGDKKIAKNQDNSKFFCFYINFVKFCGQEFEQLCYLFLHLLAAFFQTLLPQKCLQCPDNLNQCPCILKMRNK